MKQPGGLKDIMATQNGDVKARNYDNDLKKIQWSEESLKLSAFVSRYPLPQLVQIEEGFHGDENSLSAGQVLKIHTLTSERKMLCYDRHDKEVHIPLHTEQKIVLRPEDYSKVYQRVSDLARAKPLPSFVEVTRGYYNVDNNVDYELSVEPGDRLEVLSDHTSLNLTRLQKKNKSMSFRTMEGVEIKIPFDCVAGFKPLVDCKEYILSDVVPNGRTYPFYFEFVTDRESHQNLGILKCVSAYDDRLIIASTGRGSVQVVFMIPINLDVTVKVAVGTLENDPAYEDIRSSFHNFDSIENDVQSTRGAQIFRTSSELSGFTYIPGHTTVHYSKWETFEDDKKSKQNSYLSSEEIYELERKNSNEFFIEPAEHTYQVLKPLAVEDHCDTTQSADNQHGSEDSNSTNVNPVNDVDDEHPVNCIIDMSVSEICGNLGSLNMEKYVSMFEENQIDGFLFSKLEFEDFQEMGLKRLEIKKLFSFRDGWKPKL